MGLAVSGCEKFPSFFLSPLPPYPTILALKALTVLFLQNDSVYVLQELLQQFHMALRHGLQQRQRLLPHHLQCGLLPG